MRPFDKQIILPFHLTRYPHEESVVPYATKVGCIIGGLSAIDDFCTHFSDIILQAEHLFEIVKERGWHEKIVASGIRKFTGQTWRTDSSRHRSTTRHLMEVLTKVYGGMPHHESPTACMESYAFPSTNRTCYMSALLPLWQRMVGQTPALRALMSKTDKGVQVL